MPIHSMACQPSISACYADRHKIPLQHHRHRVARGAVAGFVDGGDAVFPVFATLLIT